MIIRNKKWKYTLMPSQHTLQMMTANAMEGDEQAGRDSGCDAFRSFGATSLWDIISRRDILRYMNENDEVLHAFLDR